MRRAAGGGASFRMVVVAALAAMLAACATPQSSPQQTPHPRLVNTEWKLVHFVSSDDAIGVVKPGADEKYTLLLQPGGHVAAGLSCNRGMGQWRSADAERSRGEISIEVTASSMAACPPSPLERIARDLAQVRSFVIQDGRLHLNLAMDSGDYVWEPGP